MSSRTLRHYDAIGLLAPAYIGSIGRQPDTVAALRRHHARLLAERDRLGRLAETVARTIAELEDSAVTAQRKGDSSMPRPTINRPENLFEGFAPSAYEAEARERWPEQFEHAQRAADSFTPEQMEAGQREMTARMIRMAELMAAGKPTDDPEVRTEIDWHYRFVCRFWTPDAAAYTGLGQMYVDDERFRDNYEKITEGLAVYQRDAMAAYARASLS